jgi:hypothetical protein
VAAAVVAASSGCRRPRRPPPRSQRPKVSGRVGGEPTGAGGTHGPSPPLTGIVLLTQARVRQDALVSANGYRPDESSQPYPVKVAGIRTGAAGPRTRRWREGSFSCMVVHPSGTQEHALRREHPAEAATDAPASCLSGINRAARTRGNVPTAAAPLSAVASWVRLLSNEDAKARAENLPVASRNVAVKSPSVAERERDRTQSRASAALHSGSFRLRSRSWYARRCAEPHCDDERFGESTRVSASLHAADRSRPRSAYRTWNGSWSA